ncbi:MAG: dynein regulation protein LC7 [Acidimicrobiales bacterium]|nr:MAG: dynein regulation protein LC7 [Acidimicrobiales bacterium]
MSAPITHSSPNGDSSDVSWLIESFVQQVPGVAHSVVASADGLLMASSAALPRDRADQLAAIAAGVASLTQGAATVFDGGRVSQAVVEMESGFLIVMAASGGSCLAVLASQSCDIGQVGYEMALLVERVGEVLAPQLRTSAGA